MKLEVTVSGSCLVWPTVGEGFYKILSPPPREFYLLLTFSLTFPWKPDNNNYVITRYNLRQKYPLMENCVWTGRINYMRGSCSFGLTWKQWLLKKKKIRPLQRPWQLCLCGCYKRFWLLWGMRLPSPGGFHMHPMWSHSTLEPWKTKEKSPQVAMWTAVWTTFLEKEHCSALLANFLSYFLIPSVDDCGLGIWIFSWI